MMLRGESHLSTLKAPRILKRRAAISQVICFLVIAGPPCLVASCAVSGTPLADEVPISSSMSESIEPHTEIRQTDDRGRALPFENKFPNRWSINNNGTTYEPCTYVSNVTLSRFGLNSDSVEDAALSDFQTARGCRWYYFDDPLSSLSQSVGNLVRPDLGLQGHKDRISIAFDLLPDIEVAGRAVIRGSKGQGSCSVFVRSGDAVVGTSVSRFDIVRPPTAEVCNTAVEFLRATIADIPL